MSVCTGVLRNGTFKKLIGCTGSPHGGTAVIYTDDNVGLDDGRAVASSLVVRSRLSDHYGGPITRFVLSLSPGSLRGLASRGLRHVIGSCVGQVNCSSGPFITVHRFSEGRPRIRVVIYHIGGRNVYAGSSRRGSGGVGIYHRLAGRCKLCGTGNGRTIGRSELHGVSTVHCRIVRNIVRSLRITGG